MTVGFSLLLIGFLLIIFLTAFYFLSARFIFFCLADTGSNLPVCPSAFYCSRQTPFN
jgi:hypothetical protein